MIGAVLIILISVWYYQTAIQEQKTNSFMWVAIGAATFYAVQLVLVNINVGIIESLRDPVNIFENQNLSNVQEMPINNRSTSSGFLLAAYLELMPPICGFIAAALLRTLLLLKKTPTLANLTSGFIGTISGILNGIKTTFKSSEK